MTIALIVSLFLGLFTTDNSIQQESNIDASAKITIVKPIITDDTGG